MRSCLVVLETPVEKEGLIGRPEDLEPLNFDHLMFKIGADAAHFLDLDF